MRRKHIFISLVAAILLSYSSTALAHSKYFAESAMLPFLSAWEVPTKTAHAALYLSSVIDSPIVDLKYPIDDREGDHVTDGDDNPFLLNDPAAVEKTIEYDPETNQYIITETVDGRPIKPATYMTYEEFQEYQRQELQRQYWSERAEAIELIESNGIIPPIYTGGNVFDQIFRGTKVEIRPQGNIDLTFGVNFQKIDNPTLTERQRKQGGFDFDMNINMSVVGKIGEAVKINLDYNTLATFDFENQVKLKYEGEDDQIIQELEAGNVSLSLPTSLIQGSQSLFGVRAKLRFGRLTSTIVFSQQKSQTGNLTIENGAQTQEFEVYTDQYDENRHFFLGQFFRSQYNGAMETLPIPSSLVNITRIEVWITNRTGATQNVRDVVAFQDLGETDRIFRDDVINRNPGVGRPDNDANDLYERLEDDPENRSINKIINTIQSPPFDLVGIQDFEKTFARQLNQSEYTVNPQLGFISLNQQLNPDEVLAVAYEYTFNGETYKVGDFAQDIILDTVGTPKVLYLKMLKSTSVRPKLPIWDLMMKNIYSIGAFQVNAEDFKLNVTYQDPGGGTKRYIPEGSVEGIPLISLLNLDDLNNQLDPQPDGIFDFIPGYTIYPNNGRIIFPVVEPFGDDLRSKFQPNEEIADKYVYDLLYDSTRVIAQQSPEFNRFVLEGSYKSSVSSDISLGAFNIPPGSVVVTAGGAQLTEGRDYTVDYNLGRLKIINEGVLNSGTPINVSFENNALFNFQTKTMVGARLDYRVSDKFNIGHTFMRLKERPFTQKVNIGDDPIRNSIWGFDFNYNTESEFLTRVVDKLPLYDTKEPSSVTIAGEMARLNPGHSPAIGNQGTVYIDDFEGARSTYDLKFPANSWRLASTPKGATSNVSNDLFPEAQLIDSLPYGYNRARLAWYNIDPLFLRNNSSTPDFIRDNPDEQRSHYTREINQQEIFPNFTPQTTTFNQNILTFDLAYYPEERGPYNYESLENGSPFSSGVNPDGTLKNPRSRWGGIMRDIDQPNFEQANIEFVEFWVLDPFLEDDVPSDGGFLYINLGNISEDIMRDSRFFFENGLPREGSTTPTDETNWGVVPLTQPITNAFDNNEAARAAQDIGFDGLNDDGERTKYDDAINDLSGFLDQAALDAFTADPGSDNFRYFRNGFYDDTDAGILERYKAFNNPQGNSPANTGGDFSEAATNIPDSEDLNRDNTVNENEEYFQYRIRIEPDMEVGENYITNIVEGRDNADGTPAIWYQFKVPITEFDDRIGSIPDFRSIRFIRMFLTEFEDDVVLRFARLELVRNQWRRYLPTLLQAGEFVPGDVFDETFFNVSAVNIEENSEKDPFPYVLPPGINREQNLSSQNVNALQNEQSLSVQVCGLEDGDSKAVYKTLNLDFRTYKRINMFVHGETLIGENRVNDGDLTVWLRLGSDFTDNYYEYEIPLKITPDGAGQNDGDLIWPVENEINLLLDSLIEVKKQRNAVNAPFNAPYTVVDSRGNNITIVGNPNLGEVEIAMLGIRNPKALGDANDDGLSKCAEVWFNELRLVGLDERGGWAALGRIETQLADLGSLVFSANMHTIGYGQIDQKVGERFRDDFYQYDAAANIQLGKFFPDKWGFQLPMYAGISQSFSTPEFDPYDLDVLTKDKINLLNGDEKKDYRKQVQTRVTIKSLNFTNIRIVPNNDKKIRFYSPSNFNWTYTFTETEKSDPLILSDLVKRHRVSFGYNFSPKPLYIEPFKKMIKSKSKYLDLVRDINFNPIPSNLSFSTNFNRQYGETVVRNISDDDFAIDPTFDKYFTWDRLYAIKYNPTRSISLDYTAINNARIDEPPGRIDTQAEKDSIWDNLLRFGRTTDYTQTFNANYNLPINKIPILDWVQARAGYGSSYSWIAGPLVKNDSGLVVSNPLGNTINNSQDLRLNGELNFKNLYNKSKFLKPYNSSRSRQKQTKEDRQKKIDSNKKRKEKIVSDRDKLKKDLAQIKVDIQEVKQDTSLVKEDKKARIKQLKKRRRNIKKRVQKLKKDKARVQAPESPAASPFIRPLIAIKRLSANYTETRTTTLPGYLPKTQLLGLSKGFDAPGWGFAFGIQPDRADLDEFANQGWITADTNLNYQLIQTYSKNLNLRGVVEPFRDFRVDLTLTKTESQNTAEYFKRQFSTSSEWEHLTPVTTGNYTVSFIAIRTMFSRSSDTELSKEFSQFELNRTTISQRLGEINPNSVGAFIPPNDTIASEGYADGYGPYSQNVLIPAFLAAYRGKDAGTVKLNPFKTVPLPNWRVSYNGLTKLGNLSNLFQSINITHAYNSTFTMSSYISEFNFNGTDYFNGESINEQTGNFYAQYNIPQIVVSEQFAPLIGIDIAFKNGLTANFEFRKSRNLSMSFRDYRLSESKTTGSTFGLSYRLKGLSIPNPFNKKKKATLPNAILFNFNFSYNNNVTTSLRLDQDVEEPTSGMKSFSTEASVTYDINSRLNFKLFFNRRRTVPATSAAFPITSTEAGVTIRFSLTQ